MFLWVSIGKGDLHKQSLKVLNEVDDSLTCSFLEEEFLEVELL